MKFFERKNEYYERKKQENQMLFDKLNLVLEQLKEKKLQSTQRQENENSLKNKLQISQSHGENQNENFNDNEKEPETVEAKEEKLALLKEHLEELLQEKLDINNRIQEHQEEIENINSEEQELMLAQNNLNKLLTKTKRENEIMQKINKDKDDVLEKLNENINKIMNQADSNSQSQSQQSKDSNSIFSKKKEETTPKTKLNEIIFNKKQDFLKNHKTIINTHKIAANKRYIFKLYISFFNFDLIPDGIASNLSILLNKYEIAINKRK